MGISGWQLLILLLIVVLVFGTKRLRNVGSDLGGAVKSFRKGLSDDDETSSDDETEQLRADDAPSESATRSETTRPRDI